MPVRIYKPITPGRRRASVISNEDLTKKKPERSLIKILKKKAGRSGGRITVRHRGGGAKRYYRIIDFKRNKFDIPAKVETIEYDPNRTCRIALVKYEDGEKRYILAPDGLKVGDEILSSREKIKIKIGNCLPLEHIPVGIFVHNIEISPGKGGQIARSAGSWVQVQGIEGKYAQLKMPSKEIRLVFKKCLATIGQVGLPEHRTIKIGKAGRKRWMGIKPTVRGKAMTPKDHPHGGGEGESPIGLVHPKTKWGKPALGVKTRKKKWSDRLIIKRRK